MSYWDTSTLVKLYAKELDSNIFEGHLAQSKTRLTTSRIGLYEARATFRRKEAEGTLVSGTAQLLYARLVQHIPVRDISLIEFTDMLEQEYGRILNLCYANNLRLPIRTLDAIHLAAAKTAAEKEIVTTDTRMRDAAKILGLTVFPS